MSKPYGINNPKPKLLQLFCKHKYNWYLPQTKFYIYCTKDKKNIFFPPLKKPSYKPSEIAYDPRGNGKVIGEFVCDTIITDRTFGHDPMFKALSCMNDAEIASYCTENEMYGFHISDLVIYNKPKELSEFEKPHEYIYQSYSKQNSFFKGVTRPPQSWGYVEEI